MMCVCAWPLSSGPFPAPSAVAFSPDGTMFVTGAEEGNVRLHHFDADYVSGAWADLYWLEVL